MSKLKSLLLVVLLFFFSFFFRLNFISKGPFHYDCLELAINAQKTLDTLKLHYQHFPGSPLTVILAVLNLAIFRWFSISDPVWVVNFMAVYFSSLCIVMLYLVTKELFNELTAVFTALLLSVFPPFLSVSVYGKDHAPTIFFALLCTYWLLKYLKEYKNVFLVLSGISLGLCGAMRIAETLLIIPLLSLLLMHSHPNKESLPNIRKYNLKSYVLFILSTFIPLLVFYVPFVITTGFVEIQRVLSSIGYPQFMGLFSPNILLSRNYTFGSLFLPGIILSLFGGYLIFLKNRKTSFFLALWFLVLFFYYGNISTPAPRYLITAQLPLLICIGYFLSELCRWGKLAGILAFILFLALLLRWFDYIAPVVEIRHRYTIQQNFGRSIAQNTENNAIIMAGDTRFIINYYAGRATLDIPLTCDDKVIKKFLHDYVDKYLKSGIPLYITSSCLAYDISMCGRLIYWLDKSYKIECIGGCYINEGWVRACLGINLYEDCLYKIKNKSR